MNITLRMKITNRGRMTLLSLLLLAFVSGCNTGSDQGPADTPTSGNLKISADATFGQVLNSEVDTFQHLYPNAKVSISYKTEDEAVDDLINNRVQVICISRKLTKDEYAQIQRQTYIPRQVKICFDAVAFIVNKQNKDTSLTFTDIKDILSGQASSWKQVDPKSGLSKIQIIFDNPRSGNVRFVKEKIASDLGKNNYAVKTNTDVINYVKKNPNAIGLVGVNWISDRFDTVNRSFLKDIRVMGISSSNPEADPWAYYQPYQAYIALKFYPFYREVYLISREGRNGIGSGFITFVASDRGQRIFLRAGLVPSKAPVRLVELNKTNLQINK